VLHVEISRRQIGRRHDVGVLVKDAAHNWATKSRARWDTASQGATAARTAGFRNRAVEAGQLLQGDGGRVGGHAHAPSENAHPLAARSSRSMAKLPSSAEAA